MRIGTLTSRPGTLVRGSLRVGETHVPIAILRGTRPGPVLYLQAAQHPSEMMGIEVSHHVIENLDPRKLRGEIVVAPIANPVHAAWSAGLDTHAGLMSPRRKKAVRRVNPNRAWPGKQHGNFIERLVYTLFENICRQVDAIVDLHCCRICDHYFAAALDGHRGSEELAKAFGPPLVDLQTERSYAQGLLFLVAPKLLDTPSILIEMSPDGDITYDMLANGVRGVHNLLKHLGMIPGRPELPRTQVVVRRSERTRVFRAKREGYLTTYRRVGEVVSKGELLCEVRDLDRFRPVQTVRAPYDGTAPSIGPGSGLRIVKVGEEICTFKRIARLIRN